MTQPTETFDSYDYADGIREDLQDIIYDISPEETPFYTKCRKTTASNTLHEWQTDALRASGVNAHVEGDDTDADARVATTRLGNYTQIFKNAVVIPDTDQGLDKAGRAREIGYQVLKTAKEQKLDIEAALFDNNAKAVGDSTTPRELAGVPSWVITNTNIQNGTLATGDGSDAYTPGVTPTAFSQTKFDDVMQKIWTSGGKPDTVYLDAVNMNLALAFEGNNNQRSTIKAESEKVIKHMDVYVTPWGTVEFVPSREIVSQPSAADPGNYVFVAQDDMWKVAVLRPTKNVPLAKTGDNTKRQVTTELTLCAANEKSSAAIYDNT
jgi:hypothetical protein